MQSKTWQEHIQDLLTPAALLLAILSGFYLLLMSFGVLVPTGMSEIRIACATYVLSTIFIFIKSGEKPKNHK
jgi:hypothetical protein